MEMDHKAWYVSSNSLLQCESRLNQEPVKQSQTHHVTLTPTRWLRWNSITGSWCNKGVQFRTLMGEWPEVWIRDCMLSKNCKLLCSWFQSIFLKNIVCLVPKYFHLISYNCTVYMYMVLFYLQYMYFLTKVLLFLITRLKVGNNHEALIWPVINKLL